jgi:hypothetical protein
MLRLVIVTYKMTAEFILYSTKFMIFHIVKMYKDKVFCSSIVINTVIVTAGNFEP